MVVCKTDVIAEISLMDIKNILDGLLHSIHRGDMSDIPGHEQDTLQAIYTRCRMLLDCANYDTGVHGEMIV